MSIHPWLSIHFQQELLCITISMLCSHIAFQHHERFDGGGYPRRLVGEKIHQLQVFNRREFVDSLFPE